MVRVLDLQSRGLGFKSLSDHLMDLNTVVLCSNPRPCYINSQLVRLLPVGIFKNVYVQFPFLLSSSVPYQPFHAKYIDT